MGTVVAITVENAGELWQVQMGRRKPEEVHRLEVTDALVDMDSTYLAMPKRLIKQLGFTTPFTTRRGATSLGDIELPVHGPVWLTIQGRSCHIDVVEVPELCPVLIGRIPLLQLDWVLDTENHRLIGNPAHGGKHIIEMY